MRIVSKLSATRHDLELFFRRGTMISHADRFGPSRSSQRLPVLRRLRRRDRDGAGDGFSLNFPLPPGAGDYGWLAAIEQGLARILSHRPAAMVSALGLDAA